MSLLAIKNSKFNLLLFMKFDFTKQLGFKITFLFFGLLLFSCSSSTKTLSTSEVKQKSSTTTELKPIGKIIVGAERFEHYLFDLKNKNVGIVTNQTGVIPVYNHTNNTTSYKHVVDFLIESQVKVTKIYAPEHGFRGTADAGELIVDGKDTKTGLPIVSLYGANKKPKPEHVTDINVMIFDIQDVGARFYTYISTLHYVMEACAENNIELVVFDRPNPNGTIIDGPILEKEYSSFVGMHPIPVLHGMTIGEYAKMINGEGWLKGGIKCNLKVVPCYNYKREYPYSLPIKPSPNLPNDQAINLYASLCLFEGTNVSVGRGTEKQFQIYGSPFLKEMKFEFTPVPNFGAKEPLHQDKKCFGEDLTKIKKVTRLELKWLINAYNHTEDKSTFFNEFFYKLAGTKQLKEQIEKGMTEIEIRNSWLYGLTNFKNMRKKYLIYN